MLQYHAHHSSTSQSVPSQQLSPPVEHPPSSPPTPLSANLQSTSHPRDDVPVIRRSSTLLINARTRVKIISLFRPTRLLDISSKCSNSRARLSFVSMEGVSGGVGRPRETVEEEADLFLENVAVGGSFQWWRIVPDWWETAMARE
jgi:hypothetical protein